MPFVLGSQPSPVDPSGQGGFEFSLDLDQTVLNFATLALALGRQRYRHPSNSGIGAESSARQVSRVPVCVGSNVNVSVSLVTVRCLLTMR